jgi:hypothetical protein
MATDRVIFFDDSCPLCRLYTKGFVRIGALPPDGRQGLADAADTCPESFAHLDLDRARHFIPLVDRTTGEVRYGLDALCTLLADRFPRLAPLFFSPLPKLFYPLYWLVTYNRRVIAGCPPPDHGLDCAPDLKPAPRMTYLALTLGATFALNLPIGLGAVLFLLALTLLGRGWDAIGSAATAWLTLALLLMVFPWPLAALIFALDLCRRRTMAL